MDKSIRKTLQLKVRQPDLRSLLDLSSKMPKHKREFFVVKYGNLLKLLKVKVQVEALTALAQFYDPPLRCFTFQDYQLAPTLEEFEQIMCFPSENNKPYRYVEHYPLAKTLTGILKVKEQNLAKVVVKKNGMNGLPRMYLENEASSLAGKNDWDAFMDVLALIIYGIVLFPNIDDFIDYTAIDVFLAFKNRKQSPASVILADVYYSLYVRHEKGGGLILCCLPVLYLWFTSHIFKKNYQIETKSKTEWARYITGLKGSDISWYSRSQEIEEVVYRCGEFPNVPLIGTKGCINYNPALALRQLGYVMMNPPPEESLFPFVLDERGSQNLDMLRKVSRAWVRIVKKGRELGHRGIDAKESYLQWVKIRVQDVKLPFPLDVPAGLEIPEHVPILIEDVENLKDALSKSEQEKAELQSKLEKMLQENMSLRRENAIKEKHITYGNERATIMDEKICDLQECLRGANEELEVRNRDRDRAIDNAYVWKKQLTKSMVVEKDLRGQLENMKSQLKEMKSQEKINEDLKKEITYLKDRFSRLVGLANEAITEVPERPKAADIFGSSNNTPIEKKRKMDWM